MSLNGKFLDKDHLQYFWTKIKMKFASAEQGAKADTALQQSDVSSTYSSSGTAPVNGTAVNAAIGTLDVSSVGGSGKYISAISETNGKIAATPTTFDTVLSSSSTNNNAPTSKTVYDDQERQDALEAEDRVALIGQVDNGAKSLFPIGVQSKDYSSTLSMTVNNEGVITVNGTRNDSDGGVLYQDLVTNETRYQDTRYTLPVGTYGCKGGGTANIRLQVYCHDGTNATQLFNSSEDGTFTYSQTQKQSKPYIVFRLAIQPGNVSLNNHKVYPMICTAADWAISRKFVPYRPSWQEMADNNKIIDISSQITAESGYTVESTTHLYLQNNIVFGSIAIAKDSGGYSSSLTAVAKLPEKYAPSRQFINICGFSTDQWSITNIGYGFIQSQKASSTSQRGQISVKSPTANLNHLMLQVNYPIRLDDTL